MSQSQDDFLSLDVQLVSRLYELNRAVAGLCAARPSLADRLASLAPEPLILPPGGTAAGAAAAALFLSKDRLDHYSASGVWCVAPGEVEEGFRGALDGVRERD